MRLNGGMNYAKAEAEYVKLRAAWKKWNDKCHPEDRIDWQEFYDEHKN
jgi:hypothetical protein|tara:strand:+ start:1828 stop:1971 length:144 start_codon:yes stop_codon:yes gene_type:complete